MKAILALIVAAGACIALSACESELPPSKQASSTLERGIKGQGTVFQPDRSNDPIIREPSRVGY